MYVDEFDVIVQKIDRDKKKLTLSKIALNQAVINISYDTLETANFRFIIDAISSDDELEEESESPWEINCRNIDLNNCTFRYKDFKAIASDTLYPDSSDVFNFADIEFNNLNLHLRELSLRDTIACMITKMRCEEKSGFRLDRLFGNIRYCSQGVFLDSLSFETPSSKMKSAWLSVEYEDISETEDFLNKVQLNADLTDTCIFSTKDIACFYSDLKGAESSLILTGNIHGTVSNLKGKNVHVFFGDNTHIHTDFDINGLPNLDETIIYMNAKQLTTNKSDLEQIPLPPFDENTTLELPENFAYAGNITFKGIFFGLIDDFVCTGSITSALGLISSDVRLKRDEEINDRLNIGGVLKTTDLNLGKFIGDEDLAGKITMNISTDGWFMPNGKMDATVNGFISSIGINRYDCHNIEINGEFTNKKFDGSLSITDPNLNLSFLGKCDFGKEIPEFNFTAALYNANLHELNFVESDSMSSVSVFLKTNFKGSRIDEINGDIFCDEFTYLSQDGEISSHEIYLMVNENTDHTKEIILESDFVDGEIVGAFKYETLMKSVKNLLLNSLPSISGDTSTYSHTINSNDIVGNTFNNFTFRFDIKNPKPVCDLFIPDWYISNETKILGSFDALNGDLTLAMETPQVKFGDVEFNKILFKTNSFENEINITTTCSAVYLTETEKIENIAINCVTRNDSVSFDFEWKNYSKQKYSGLVSTYALLSKVPGKEMPVIDVFFRPSELFIADTSWLIKPGSIRIDTSCFKINNFEISNVQQSLAVNGTVSQRTNDSLIVDFRNIELANLNVLLSNDSLISGTLSGTTILTNLYKHPYITTDDSVRNILVNGESFGDLYLESNWKPEDQVIHLNAYLKRNILKTVNISGDYYPENSQLDFNISLEKTRLNMLEPFVKNFVNQLVGRAGGNFAVKGTVDNPLIEGKVGLQKTGFTVNYLQTRYNFTTGDSILITNNAFTIKDLLIKSSNGKGNQALLNAKITHNNFEDIALDIGLDIDNFLLMNTTAADNETFYGTAYATGIVKISGNPDNIIIDVSAKTEKDTYFYIPLTTGGEATEIHNFITYINTVDVANNKTEDNYEVDLSGIQLNFDFNVTPEAEVQLIMDEKVGDIIKARGTGDIRMKINTLGDFAMFGDYNIDKGDYLLTLGNIINKKFDVEQDGTIKWNGDPTDATINLNAIYDIQKVSIYDLLLDESMKDERVTVDCNLLMTGKLMNPEIKFDISLPESNTDDRIKSQIANLSSDEMNKQFLFLLVMNRFQPLPGLKSGIDSPDGAVSTNGYELLTNQLNHWLSQISKDFDIGINYRPGDDISNDQLELALGKKLLNDRIEINIGGGISTNASNTETSRSNSENDLVGDMSIEYKITGNGKLRTRYYAKSNDELLEDSPYTQGIGLFYREDFDSFSELIKGYWIKIKNIGKKDKEKSEK